MSVRVRLAILIAFLFASAIGNSVFTFKLEQYGEEKLKWVIHTHEVIIETENYLSAMQDTETGQRGYLLTKDYSYADPYHKGLTKARQSFKVLKRLTSDNAKQKERLNEIEKQMELKLNELAETINLTKSNKFNDAIKIVKANIGKQYMENIRDIIDDFITEEKILLEKRRGDFREHRAQLTTLIIIEVMFFLFLACITVSFLIRNLFTPLKSLLNSTNKMEQGKKIEITDIVPDDEMGYLLSRFYIMNEKVHNHTQKLNYQANHDELTGLKNRAKLFETLDSSIKLAVASKTKVALLFLDLNKFKQLNDTMGHEAGDLMLKKTADRLSNSIRDNDSAFRNGGDEFIVLIKDITKLEQVRTVADKILHAFDTPMLIHNKNINATVSIGVSIAPDHSKSTDEIIKMADIAMYAAKSEDSNNYKIFDQTMFKRSDD